MKTETEFAVVDQNQQGWWHIYNCILDDLCFRGARILDLGCGWRYLSHCRQLESKSEATCIGVDIDPLISKQIGLTLKTRADAHFPPFKSEVFDLISSVYVLEHIAFPERFFSGVFHSLRWGGKLLLITNSCYNPVVWMAKLFPSESHRFIIQKILNWQERDFDNAPVFYRANTRGSLFRLCAESGFHHAKVVHLSGMYEYIHYPVIRNATINVGNALTNNKVLSFLKMNLILIATK